MIRRSPASCGELADGFDRSSALSGHRAGAVPGNHAGAWFVAICLFLHGCGGAHGLVPIAKGIAARLNRFLLRVSGYWISSGCLETFPPLGVSPHDFEASAHARGFLFAHSIAGPTRVGHDFTPRTQVFGR
jgi:hypothetical protein